ncbi:hypothetical protein CPB86DRAFT_785954, partial [Serendipita vermifera]
IQEAYRLEGERMQQQYWLEWERMDDQRWNDDIHSANVTKGFWFLVGFIMFLSVVIVGELDGNTGEGVFFYFAFYIFVGYASAWLESPKLCFVSLWLVLGLARHNTNKVQVPGL